MDLNGKKFLAIGGAGLIGSHTVDQLLKHDVAEVIIFDNFVRGNLQNLGSAIDDPRLKIFEAGGDICQPDILDDAIKNCDGVFHFAALWLLQCHEYPRTAFQTNIQGMFNVLDSCAKHKIQRLVWSSSASVYGDAMKEPMTEDHPLNNKNFYGATKICAEAMATAYTHRYGLEQVGLRYMNVYGPRQDYKGAYIAVIMKMLDAIDQGEAPTIFGDGSEAFDFVSVLDCAKANICAMRSSSSGDYYNVGTGKRTSLRELAEKILELKECTLPINYKEASSATLVRNRIGCPKKAKSDLGFEAEVSLEEGLSKLIEWRDRDIKNNSPVKI